MTIPYYARILLEPYASHPLIGPAITAGLTGVCGTGSMIQRIHDDSVNLSALSHGEIVTVQLAMALWNGNRQIAVADLFHFDQAHQRRACDAIAAKFTYSTEEE